MFSQLVPVLSFPVVGNRLAPLCLYGVSGDLLHLGSCRVPPAQDAFGSLSPADWVKTTMLVSLLLRCVLLLTPVDTGLLEADSDQLWDPL